MVDGGKAPEIMGEAVIDRPMRAMLLRLKERSEPQLIEGLRGRIDARRLCALGLAIEVRKGEFKLTQEGEALR